MVNAQEWLDKNYSLDQRKEIRELNISDKELESNLILDNWSNLETIDCSSNQLINLTLHDCLKFNYVGCSENKLSRLIVVDCPELKELYANRNSLSNLDNIPSPEKLTYLNISRNAFSAQDLSFVSRFASLERIDLDNNPFCGSLKPLRNLSKLKELDISDTNIDSGLEYLPSSLEWIRCNDKIAEKLQGYELTYSHYDYQAWRNNHLDLIANAQKIVELEDSLNNLSLVSQGIQVFKSETEEKINKLKNQNQEYYQNKTEIPPK